MTKLADKIWLNGQMVAWEDAKVHVLTHALHYGTSVFEGIRAYDTPNGSVGFRLRDHLVRLEDSARIYGIKRLAGDPRGASAPAAKSKVSA